jgi:hypothetical protein
MTTHRAFTGRPVAGRPLAPLTAVAAAALVLAGCTGTTTPSAVASAVVNASIPPIATEAPSVAPSEATGSSSEEPTESEGPSAVATDIDPCQLITADEAGKLTGTTFGPGKESVSDKNVRSCNYAAAGGNLFTVEVAVAPDEATAKAAEDAAKQDLQDQAQKSANLPLKITQLPNFAPNTDAALMEASVTSPIQFGARAMLVLRGTTFFAFDDVAVGGQPPSAQAMQDEAMTVLGKLP